MMKCLLCFLLLLIQISTLSAQTWKADLKEADSLMRKRDFKNATLLYEQILPLIENSSTKATDTYFNVRNNLGRCASVLWDKEKATAFLEENINLCKAESPKSAPYAQALHNIGTFYLPTFKGNNPVLSKSFLEEAAALRKEILGEKHVDYAASLNNLGILYERIGSYDKSMMNHKKCLQIRKEALGEKHPDYGQSLNNLAVMYYLLGKYSESEALYKESQKNIAEVFGTRHPDYLRAITNLASLYSMIGSYSMAEALYKEGLSIKKEVLGEKHLDYLQTLANFADYCHLIGNYTLAESYYKECLKKLQDVLGKEHPDYAQLLNNIGNFYEDIGNLNASMILHTEALHIRKTSLGSKHPNYAQSVSNLANLHWKMGNFIEADALQREALSIRKETLGENHSEYLESLNNLAILHHQIGNFQAAEAFYKQGLSSQCELITQKNILYAHFASNLANLYCLRNNLLPVDSLFHESLDVYKNRLSDNHPQYISGLKNLSDFNWLKGNKILALEQTATAKQWGIRQIKTQFPHLSEFQKSTFFNETIKIYLDTYNSYAIEMPRIDTKALYDLQLSSKALLMHASQKMKNRILNSGDTALVKKYGEWNVLKEQIIKATEMSESTRQAKGIKLDSLTNASEDLEKELSKKSESFASLTDQKRTTWQDIQKTLKKGEAAIEIVRTNKYGLAKVVTDTSDVAKAPNFPQYPIYGLTDTAYYAVLIIKKSSKQPEIVLIKNGNELEEKFAVYQKNTIQFMQEDLISYDQFWLPIAQKLKGIKKVYFSPDGVYNQISLNTLQNPKTKKFVLDEIELHLVTNTKDILAFGKSENKTLKAELLGYPLYDLQTQNADAARMREVLADSTRAFANFQQVSLLPGTKKEVEDIFQILSQKKYSLEILTEQNATEENIKKVKNPKILHLSTHGFFIDSKEKNEKVNPMLRSGLLLTGVSDYTRAEVKPDTEDGILTALEAANLDLDETDLVVLSACETGLGDVKAGEGVYGLQRAFKVAGVKSIVMSMWKVDDAVTQKLMTTFYQKFAESNKARQAFKEAQAIIKKQHPEPYYWGAFVMVGE